MNTPLCVFVSYICPTGQCKSLCTPVFTDFNQYYGFVNVFNFNLKSKLPLFLCVVVFSVVNALVYSSSQSWIEFSSRDVMYTGQA